MYIYADIQVRSCADISIDIQMDIQAINLFRVLIISLASGHLNLDIFLHI